MSSIPPHVSPCRKAAKDLGPSTPAVAMAVSLGNRNRHRVFPLTFQKEIPTLLPEPSRAGGIGSNGSLPASWETAPPAADRLRSGPAASGADDSNPCDKELCVDSGLASLGAFCGVFRPQGRLCRSQAPWHGRSAASVPSWDKIPILSFIESSMTRLESYPTIRPWLTSGVGSPLSPSPHPPDLTSHLSSAICHLSSAIGHLPSVIRLFSFPIPRSEFRIPHFLAERFWFRLSRSPMAHLPGSLTPKEIRSGYGRRHVETTRSTQHRPRSTSTQTAAGRARYRSILTNRSAASLTSHLFYPLPHVLFCHFAANAAKFT